VAEYSSPFLAVFPKISNEQILLLPSAFASFVPILLNLSRVTDFRVILDYFGL